MCVVMQVYRLVSLLFRCLSHIYTRIQAQHLTVKTLHLYFDSLLQKSEYAKHVQRITKNENQSFHAALRKGIDQKGTS
uniref:Uncharacterized protein n=1 Tax=Arundo donax TaxID=35708 RepID=A0A0A9B6T9_ARUDO